ncbi:hypothetical protein [Anaeroselena agilis]|uniref:Uncharacterized protein n=1 Tax=Anaeroselena agilis TaxID=3063788 RepID=A0ABU3P2P3_9FIRM|nr:hypothetical protein [Selenomonadales bacterium 4137-cl]
MATTSTDAVSQTIIDTLLADVNAIVPNYVSLVNSYRLLVGAAEETHRIPGVTPDAVARAIERFDRSGVLIDIIIDLLCCKIAFSSELLAVTCAPVDIFRLLANRFDVADTPHLVAEEILVLEVVRRAQERLRGVGPVPPCTPPGGPPYTFATSCYVPPPPPPPPIPPEPPFTPPCFVPVSAEEGVPAPPAKSASDTNEVADNAEKKRKGSAARRDCNPLRPRRLKR